MQSTTQQCPPWTLRAWPPLLWQVGRQVPAGLHHLGTQVTHAADPAAGTAGQTLWAASDGQGAVGLAWDWVQLQGGVLAMADPMAVMSNLRLVGGEGELLTPYVSARYFCAMVHALPWQQTVEQALEQVLEQAVATRAGHGAASVQLAA